MRTLLFYSLLQIPGLAILGLALAVAVQFEWLSSPLALGIGLAWLIKDVVMYPFVKSAFAPGAPGDSGPAGLVGLIAVTTRDLSPSGFIRVRGELWQAECVPEDFVDSDPDGQRDPAAGASTSGTVMPTPVIAGNQQVKIVAARGMVLLVRPHR
ncbi:MAG: NfeD family protein [Leptospirales bacterium]|jgi:membrane protein implicated in regulation of membrane protease activity